MGPPSAATSHGSLQVHLFPTYATHQPEAGTWSVNIHGCESGVSILYAHTSRQDTRGVYRWRIL